MITAIDAFKDAIDSGEAKKAREAAQLSQTDVAQLLGISPAAISRWESGSRVPNEDLAAQYLAAIGITSLQNDDECPPGTHKMPDGTCMENNVHPTGGDSTSYGIEGVAVLEGRWTGDGRQFAAGGLSWPDPAETNIPLQWQKETTHGGINDVTVNVGRVTALERDGEKINVTGVIDAQSDDGAEVVRRMSSDPPTLAGVSIIADDPENGDIEVVFDGDEPVGVLFHTGRIRALTLVDVPAFAEAEIRLTELEVAESEVDHFGSSNNVSSATTWDGSTSRFSDEQWRMSTAACDAGGTPKESCFLPHHEPGGALNLSGLSAAAGRANQLSGRSSAAVSRAKSHLRGHYRAQGLEIPDNLAAEGETMTADGLDDLRAIIAAAATITIDDAPPKQWFDEPQELPRAGAITVTDEGRFYGLLAPAHVAHRSFKNQRVEVPTGNVDYSRWMNRETITADGTRITTGVITMECGHASTSPMFRSSPGNAVQHYDNSCSVVATARIGENAHGVWIAGALLPDVDRAQVARLMACQLSGDWQVHRESPGMREFVAALAVPVPGFPVGDNDPSLRMNEGLLVSSASPIQWVAAGAVPDDETDDPEPETDVVESQAEEAASDVDVVIDDLPSPEEAAEARKVEAKARIAAMRKNLGLEDE